LNPNASRLRFSADEREAYLKHRNSSLAEAVEDAAEDYQPSTEETPAVSS
jgi:hypothetical protein